MFRKLKNFIQRGMKGYCDEDIYDIEYWFLTIMPKMLEEFKQKKNGYPYQFNNEEEWDKELDLMINDLIDANENTCRYKNVYEEPYQKAYEEFIKEYGMMGEKLMTNAERHSAIKNGKYTYHSMNEVDKYKDISNKYFEKEKYIANIQDKCKNEALDTFKHYFWNLWY